MFCPRSRSERHTYVISPTGCNAGIIVDLVLTVIPGTSTDDCGPFFSQNDSHHALCAAFSADSAAAYAAGIDFCSQRELPAAVARRDKTDVV